MTKKTTDSKTASRSNPKPASHVDVTPKKTEEETALRPRTLEPGEMLEEGELPTSALEPATIEPLPPPLSVAVSDPNPVPEPHQPSGADEIMRRHRLIDPVTAEAKIEAEADTKAEEEAGKGNRS